MRSFRNARQGRLSLWTSRAPGDSVEFAEGRTLRGGATPRCVCDIAPKAVSRRLPGTPSTLRRRALLSARRSAKLSCSDLVKNRRANADAPLAGGEDCPSIGAQVRPRLPAFAHRSVHRQKRLSPKAPMKINNLTCQSKSRKYFIAFLLNPSGSGFKNAVNYRRKVSVRSATGVAGFR